MDLFKKWIGGRSDDAPVSEECSLDEIVENLTEGNQLIIFKASPRCFTSLIIEKKFEDWYQENSDGNLRLVKVNVITQRPLSIEIAGRYKIVHQSPQLIWIDQNEKVIWHGSHHSINTDVLDNLLKEQLKKIK